MAETRCVSRGVITKPLAAFHTIASPGPNNQLNKPPCSSVYPTITSISGYHIAATLGNTIIDPTEDREDMESAINGWKWKMLVWDLDQHLRSELKYNDAVTGEVYEALEKIRERLHELKTDSGLTLE